MTELFGMLAARYKAANIAFPSLKYVAIENTKHCLILAFAVLAFETASCSNAQHPEPKTTGVDHADSSILQATRQVVEAFKAKDGKRLAKLVHPEKGVRFSPSAYVDVESEVVFFRAKVGQFWTDRKTYTWGFADVSAPA